MKHACFTAETPDVSLAITCTADDFVEDVKFHGDDQELDIVAKNLLVWLHKARVHWQFKARVARG